MSRNDVRSPLLDAGPVLLILFGVLVAAGLLFFAMSNEASAAVNKAEVRADAVDAQLRGQGPIVQVEEAQVPEIESVKPLGKPLITPPPGRLAAPIYPVGALPPRKPEGGGGGGGDEEEDPVEVQKIQPVLIVPAGIQAEVVEGVPAIRVTWTPGSLSGEGTENMEEATDAGYILMRASESRRGGPGRWEMVNNGLTTDTEYLDLGTAMGEKYYYSVAHATGFNNYDLEKYHGGTAVWPKDAKAPTDVSLPDGSTVMSTSTVATEEGVAVDQGAGLLSWSFYKYDRNIEGQWELEARIERWEWFEPRSGEFDFMGDREAMWVRFVLDIKGIRDFTPIGGSFDPFQLMNLPADPENYPGVVFGNPLNNHIETALLAQVFDGTHFIKLSQEDLVKVLESYSPRPLDFKTGWQWAYFDDIEKVGKVENPDGEEVVISPFLTKQVPVTKIPESQARPTGAVTGGNQPAGNGGSENGTEDNEGDEGSDDGDAETDPEGDPEDEDMEEME